MKLVIKHKITDIKQYEYFIRERARIRGNSPYLNMFVYCQ